MSLGGNKSRQTQQSTAEQQSSGFNFNQSNQGSNQSAINRDFGTDIWGPQQGHLQNLYSQAGNALSNFTGADSMATMGAAGQHLMGMLNPGMDPAMGAYANRMGQDFREQFLPQLQTAAAGAGALGGSRHQIGAALGADRAMQGIGDFAANSYAGQQQRSLEAANQLGGIADFQRQMPFYGLSQYQGLLGAPVMQGLGGFGSSQGSSFGNSIGYGANQSTGTSQSTGSSKSSGFSFMSKPG